MCGIAGYSGPEPLPRERLEAASRTLHHRGPNAGGYYTARTPAGRHVHLIHRRLRIVDLDQRADQPFHYGGTVLVFNGEIYNHPQLRQDRLLGEKRFDTSCDTEVLARLISMEGMAGLEAAEGMWALAAYDEASGDLTLSRDRFGEKPLYLHADGDGLYFASEVKALVALLGRPLKPNLDQIRRYLVNGYKALYKTPSTFHQGLRQLPPGHALLLADGKAPVETRYWTPTFEEDPGLSFEAAVAQVRGAFFRSVELRLRADVPLAFCMSGGVDSNAIICTAKKEFGHDVHGFTIANTDARYEEAEMVDEVVAALKLDHTALPVTSEDFIAELRQLVRAHDGPLATISYFAHAQLLRAISAAGYRVSLSGTGADELFSGYYDHHNAYLAEMMADGAGHGEALANWRREIAPLVRNPFLGDPDIFVTAPDQRGHIYLDAEAFAGRLTAPWHEAFEERRYRPGLLRNRMANELFHEVVPPILAEDDLNAMAVSVENRSPYLDRDLFQLAQRIPTRHLIRDGRAKAVLRAAMRGIVPDRVLDNPRKVGFNAPIQDLLDTRDPAILDDGPIFELVEREKLADLLKRESLPESESKFLFNFLNAKLFLEEAA